MVGWTVCKKEKQKRTLKYSYIPIVFTYVHTLIILQRGNIDKPNGKSKQPWKATSKVGAAREAQKYIAVSKQFRGVEKKITKIQKVEVFLIKNFPSPVVNNIQHVLDAVRQSSWWYRTTEGSFRQKLKNVKDRMFLHCFRRDPQKFVYDF